MLITINGCARCGANHVVEMRELARPFAPPEAAPIAWTHWAPCPTNGDPILLSTSDIADRAHAIGAAIDKLVDAAETDARRAAQGERSEDAHGEWKLTNPETPTAREELEKLLGIEAP